LVIIDQGNANGIVFHGFLRFLLLQDNTLPLTGQSWG